jgi:hypothetical protein
MNCKDCLYFFPTEFVKIGKENYNVIREKTEEKLAYYNKRNIIESSYNYGRCTNQN